MLCDALIGYLCVDFEAFAATQRALTSLSFVQDEGKVMDLSKLDCSALTLLIMRSDTSSFYSFCSLLKALPALRTVHFTLGQLALSVSIEAAQ